MIDQKYLSDNYVQRIPEHTLSSLIRYIEERTITGGFLDAVLCNDLKGACSRADSYNQPVIFEIVYFLYNYAPSACWGSPEKVDAWLSAR